jgi:4-amino-4-deoxy-L-arabinose transferase-like glycosyltransferase
VEIIENEGVEYTRLAWNWFHGQGYVSVFGGTHTLFPPFYPFLIGVVAPLAGSEEAAARVVSLVAGLVLVAAVHGLARAVFDDRVALLAGALAALHPALVALSVTTFSGAPYVGLAGAATYAAVACLRRPGGSRAAATGLFAGLAYLTRPEGLLLALGLGGLLLASGVLRHRSWRKGLRDAGIAVGVAAILAAPYVAHLSRIAGGFRWEGKSAVNNLITERLRSGLGYGEAGRGLGPDASPEGPFLLGDQHALLARAGDGGDGLVHSVASVPRWRIRHLATWVATAGFLGAPAVVLLALAGLGLRRWWRDRGLEGLALLGMPAIVGLALLTLQFQWDRYLLPLLPAALVWAAVGADRLGLLAARLAHRLGTPDDTARFARRAVTVGLALAVLATAAPAVPGIEDLHQTRSPGIRAAGAWLRQDHARSPAAALARRPLIAAVGLALGHYAEGRITYLPHADETRALAYLRRVDPDYLALRYSEARRLPYAAAWLRRGPADTCATPVRELPSAAAGTVRLWRWTCDPGAGAAGRPIGMEPSTTPARSREDG